LTAPRTPGIRLLIASADPSLVERIRQDICEKQGVSAEGVSCDAIHAFTRERPRIVLIDLGSCENSDLLHQVVALDPATEVILINGRHSIDAAVEAIQNGACDYLPNPLNFEKLQSRVEGLIAEAEDRKKTLELDTELMDAYQFQGIVGRSPLMLDLFEKLRRVGPHFQTVLITGQTGTGKELVARALHNLSPVGSRSFVVSNCSAIVQTLLESELFGHVRGAFTGATHDKVGVFEHADGGTVFLDEIGELSLEAQAKLLRVIQNHELQRVGSPVQRKIDVRVVAATNRDLRRMVAGGRFREDLYYRIAMVELTLPRLAERKEDLPLLQRHFLANFSKQYKKEITGITRRAQICFARHHWPGNVRELENAIGNACMMTESRVIDVADLPEHVRNSEALQIQPAGLVSFAELQNKHLLYVLAEVRGNKARAAEILGISRTTLYEMLARMDVENTVKAASTKAGAFS
jgi:DNA-binding NtrC family response regulator